MTQPLINSDQLITGTGEGSVVKLENIGSPPVVGLPLTDGSQLTGLSTDPTTGNVATPTVHLDDGTSGDPSYSFTSDIDTGFYRAGTNSIGVAVGGNLAVTFNTTNVTIASGLQYLAPLDSGTPTYSFVGDATTGMSGNAIPGRLEFFTSSVNTLEIRATYLRPLVQTRNIDGTAGAPSYSFNSNQTTGMFKDGAGATDPIAFSVNSQESLNIESDGTLNVSAVTNYETLVIDDDDIPNKKYVDDNYSPLTINTQTGTSYVLLLTDAGTYVRMTNAAANTVEVPANADVAFEIGTEIIIRQAGAGKTTLVSPGSPAVILNSGGDGSPPPLGIAAQHNSLSIIKVGTDEWDISGALG
jgi:hypothetical protein